MACQDCECPCDPVLKATPGRELSTAVRNAEILGCDPRFRGGTAWRPVCPSKQICRVLHGCFNVNCLSAMQGEVLVELGDKGPL